jgi:sugar O-acyltransferase (sialic acid O-acetyltransferase NeuD family)
VAPVTGESSRRRGVATGRPVPLVIVGAGGFGRELADLICDINAASPAFDVLGFVDDGTVRLDLLERLGVPLLGPVSTLAETGARHVIAIAAPGARRRIDLLARAAGSPAVILRHPAATISRDAEIAEGTVIAAGARITTHVVIGRHVHVNMNCTIGHDAVLKDFVTLFAGVHLGGGVVVEEGATLGTGAVILPGVRVGQGAVVGAGATVVRDVEPNTTVVTAPARPTVAVRGEPGRRD